MSVLCTRNLVIGVLGASRVGTRPTPTIYQYVIRLIHEVL